ncbi:PilZ domain-containing protein [Marinobacter sp. SS21]|uniref:PilZ domain-containing protein n=1 Tax=Marinobacter sp. SS21 TaxID=2979460 RepID=UPI00232C1412|nr:PilZ domain-containing protein [Marinobacter sp. SS21]MDC0661856.1 PilZ domain-containing protein [Marinobacter sp. SS21]
MTSEKRTDYRLTGKVNVFLELDSGDPDVGDGITRLEAFSTDLSIAGLRLQCRQPLQEGALLPATVSLVCAKEPFRLMTEVIWCRAVEERCWAAGLKILESDETSFLEWVEAVGLAMGQD